MDDGKGGLFYDSSVGEAVVLRKHCNKRRNMKSIRSNIFALQIWLLSDFMFLFLFFQYFLVQAASRIWQEIYNATVVS